MKRSSRIVLCTESPYNLIDVLGTFSAILQPLNFSIVKLSDTSSADETSMRQREQSQKYFDLSVLQVFFSLDTSQGLLRTDTETVRLHHVTLHL